LAVTRSNSVPDFTKFYVFTNNPWLSYSDLKIENLGAIRHFGFD